MRGTPSSKIWVAKIRVQKWSLVQSLCPRRVRVSGKCTVRRADESPLKPAASTSTAWMRAVEAGTRSVCMVAVQDQRKTRENGEKRKMTKMTQEKQRTSNNMCCVRLHCACALSLTMATNTTTAHRSGCFHSDAGAHARTRKRCVGTFDSSLHKILTCQT